jgi:hypothetical protein
VYLSGDGSGATSEPIPVLLKPSRKESDIERRVAVCVVTSGGRKLAHVNRVGEGQITHHPDYYYLRFVRKLGGWTGVALDTHLLELVVR